MSDERRLTVQNEGYSRSPWRIIDSLTGQQVPGPGPVEQLPGGPPMPQVGFDTKAEAVEWLGVLAARWLTVMAVRSDRTETGLSAPETPNIDDGDAETARNGGSQVCPLCMGDACEYGCRRCRQKYAGPDSHRVCRRCGGAGVIDPEATA